jgi:nucleoside-diphosphate-sugar epimerase
MHTLVIGGTRNLGPPLVKALLARGDIVTILHRGRTQFMFESHVERLHADRSDAAQLALVLAGRSFDLVVDTTLYTGRDAEVIAQLFAGRTERYIMISTGQVYLVRPGLKRPFREQDYDGPTMPPPPAEHSLDHENWLYGIEKRKAEDSLLTAHREYGFPVTALRLPMVNSERDHFDRILGYLARLWDGGPILVPEGAHLALRHVYGEDVIDAIIQLSESHRTVGRAYNISQDETVELEAFLRLMAEFAGATLRVIPVPRATLDAQGLLPFSSPFSGLWMSELDNQLSKSEVGIRYTPLRTYLEKLVAHFRLAPRRTPLGYDRRIAEIRLARTIRS